MSLLELVMIVKNGADTLEPVLTSIKPYIDSWSILDTGSTDGTQELIRKSLAGVPGSLYEEPFVDFSTSRNRILELAGNKCQYTLMLDDSYVLHGGKELRKILQQYPEKAFLIRITDKTSQYYSMRVLNTKSNIRYKYLVHEIPDFSNGLNISEEEIFIEDLKTENQNKRSYLRHFRDYELLQKDLEKEPNNPRIIKYLGTTAVRIKKFREAKEWFDKLYKIPGNPSERYEAMITDGEITYKELGGSYLDYIRNLEKCVQEFPMRAEPYYKLAVIYRSLGEATTALSWVRLGANVPIPQSIEPIETFIYKVEIPYLMIELCLQQKIIEPVVPLVKRMIKEYPSDFRFLNIKHALTENKSSVKKLEKPVVVFHIGESSELINPRLSQKFSELFEITRKTAQMLLNKNYRVIIFGNFKNHEGNFGGIDYIHHLYYQEFVENYKVDILIVSEGKHLCLFDNIQKVYLMPSYIVPSEGYIQIHPQKFKGIIANLYWQQVNIQKYWNIDASNFHKVFYPIETSWFQVPEKISRRFLSINPTIETIDRLLQLWPIIKEKYSDASLHIISQYSRETDSSIQFISDKSERNIAEEINEAEVYLHLDLEESTYHLDTIRAQASGCVCFCLKTNMMLELLRGKGTLLEDDSEDIIRKIFFTLDNGTIKKSLSEKARVWGMSQSYSNYVSELEKIFLK